MQLPSLLPNGAAVPFGVFGVSPWWVSEQLHAASGGAHVVGCSQPGWAPLGLVISQKHVVASAPATYHGST